MLEVKFQEGMNESSFVSCVINNHPHKAVPLICPGSFPWLTCIVCLLWKDHQHYLFCVYWNITVSLLLAKAHYIFLSSWEEIHA